MSSADPLLQPFQLKHLTLRNRIMSTSHEPAYAEDGKPKLRYQLYHEEKAKGGIALTMFGGSTNVAADSPSIFGQLYAGDDSIVPWFRQMADRIHAHGAAAMIQLTHLGRRTVWDDGDWLPTIAPSSVREQTHRSFPKEMDEADIRRVVKAFGAAARRVKEGGLDGLEVEAYGHLLDQFWSPVVNKRTDRYGGSLDNRLRFSLEVFEAIRREVGEDFIVGIRMTGEEDVPGGLTKDDGLTIATKLAKTGLIDFVNIIRGWVGTDESLSRVIPGMGTPFGPHLQFAATFKEEVGLPLFHANRIADIATARYAIGEGLLDMVGMTRAHIADPYIVRKLELGQEDRIRPCVGATYCLSRIYLGLDALCLHNPATGREETMSHFVEPTDGPIKKVVVVGGGPGGLEAARVAAERGHSVVLCEAGPELGGQVLLAARATQRRKDLVGITEWLAGECRHGGVDIRLNSPVEAADVLELEPDVVLVATGGWPRLPPLDEGAELVATVVDIIAGSVKPSSGEVLLYDDHGNEQALSCVERLVSAGGSLEIVTPDRYVGQEITGTLYPPYLKAVYEHGVRLTPDHRVTSVRKRDGRLEVDLWNDYTKTTHRRVVDQVVVENGTEPNADIFFDLVKGSVNEGVVDLDAYVDGRPQELVTNLEGDYQLFRLGDAVSSRNIHAAIYEARRLCMRL